MNGTRADGFGAAGDAGDVNVFGLQYTVVNTYSQEQARSTGSRSTRWAATTSSIRCAAQADGIQLTMNRALGVDTLHGSQGNDLFNGGDGNDIAFMGAGDDTFVWNLATTTTPSRVRTASTAWRSTAPTSPRTSTSRRRGGSVVLP